MSPPSPFGPSPVTLRPGRPSDALCLGVLGTQVFLDTYALGGIRPAIAEEALRSFSIAAMRDVLARPGTLVQVAESDGHLVGFSQTALEVAQPLVVGLRPAELQRLYVQEPFTGRGLGGRLLRAAEEEAARRDASGLWLTPWVHNARALAFYAKHGYVDLGEAWFEMEGERHENRVLFKALEASAANRR